MEQDFSSGMDSPVKAASLPIPSLPAHYPFGSLPERPPPLCRETERQALRGAREKERADKERERERQRLEMEKRRTDPLLSRK